MILRYDQLDNHCFAESLNLSPPPDANFSFIWKHGLSVLGQIVKTSLLFPKHLSLGTLSIGTEYSA